MSLTFDEHGRPFLIVKEQGKKQRLTGIDAQKVRVLFVVMETDHYVVTYPRCQDCGQHFKDLSWSQG